jgi:hypothetical protein
MKRTMGLTAAAAIAVLLVASSIGGCSRPQKLPRDANLELYVTMSARCAYVDRAFSNDPELFREEIAEVNLPQNWKEISDSLVTRYGTDVKFWYQVYSEILERSRK